MFEIRILFTAYGLIVERMRLPGFVE